MVTLTPSSGFTSHFYSSLIFDLREEYTCLGGNDRDVGGTIGSENCRFLDHLSFPSFLIVPSDRSARDGAHADLALFSGRSQMVQALSCHQVSLLDVS